MVLIGVCMTGPRPASMSKGMPMPVKGVRMSENRMTPSGLKARQGCSEISTCISLTSKQHIDCDRVSKQHVDCDSACRDV